MYIFGNHGRTSFVVIDISSANNLRPAPLHFLVSPSSISLPLMKNSNTSICSSAPETNAALSAKPRMAAAPNEPSSSSTTTVSGGVRRSRRTHLRKKISRNEEESDEKDEFEKKIEALKKIVPGGETLAVENLFEETADYILSLQYRVEALRFLVAFVESSESNKRKLGG